MRRNQLKWIGTVITLIIALSTVTLSAQVSTADIVGTVTDGTGAAVPDATVTVTNNSTSEVRTQTSGASGEFTVTTLRIGSYTVKVQHAGFKTYTTTVSLSIGDRLRVTAALDVGAIDQTIDVSTATAALQTQTSSTGTLIPNTSVENLPLNGRNFITLVQLAAGAADSTVGFSGGAATDDRRLTSQVQINGQFSFSNNYMIDGMDNNERFIGTITVKPAIESIQEMRITTSNYSADLGRTAGGAINMITKSGTNAFHGSAFEFFRNQAMDARNYFARTGAKPTFGQNQFGGSIGGPIRKGKTFFFLDYEALRLKQAAIVTSTVPIANGVTPLVAASVSSAPTFIPYNGSGGVRTGNFSGYPAIFDPIQGCASASTCTTSGARPRFTGNVIPTNRLDKAGIALINLYPLPNIGAPGTLTNNYLSTPTTSNFQDTMDMRVDNKFSDKNSAYLRYTYSVIRANIPGAIPPVANGTYTNQSTHALAFDVVHIFTPKLLMELQAGWGRFALATLPGSYGKNLTSTLLGIQNANTDLMSSAISNFTVNDGFMSGAGDQAFSPEFNTNDTFEINGSVVRQWGNHSFKLGAVDRYRMNTIYQQASAPGTFPFSTLQTSQLGTGAGGDVGGFGIASLELGYPNGPSRVKQLSQPDYIYKEVGAYMQDDWRARSWLTLNLGVRYDYYGSPYTTNNQIVNFNFGTERLQQAGVGSFGRSAGVSISKVNFSPRLGFAATLGKSTVVRGGFGTSYVPYFIGTNASMRNAPFTSQLAPPPTGAYFPNFALTNLNAAGTANSSAAAVIPVLPVATPDDPNAPRGTILATRTNLALPYVYQTNVSVQQQFGANTATVTYVGIFGQQQPFPNAAIDVNQATPGLPSTATTRRPFNSAFPGPAFANVSQIALYGNTTTNSYNGLQVSFERRFARGLEVTGNYTYAHAIDNYEYQPLDNSQIVANPFSGYRLIKGNSSIDLRQRFSLTVSYKIKTGLHGFMGGAVNGWGINAIFQTQTGLPFNVTNSTDVAGTNNQGGNRPDVVGDYTKGGNIGTATGCPTDVHSSHSYTTSGNGNIQWFNTCAFVSQPQATTANPTIARYGTLGRLAQFGPHQTGLAFSAGKEFPIYERVKLQFRGELFNAFNHPVFGLPSGTFGGTFGQINSTAAGSLGLPRNVQVSAKLTF